MKPRWDDEQIFRYLEDDLPRSEAEAFERALEESGELRERLEAERALHGSMRRASPDVDEVDLVAAVRRARSEPAENHRARRWVFTGAIAACLLTALASAPLLLDDGFTSKSAGPARAEKWSGIRAYVVDAEGTARPVGRSLRADASLSFTYTNLEGSEHSHLMIFAVDHRREVFWYHPPYEDEHSTPFSIPIERGRADVPLPDRIEHDLVPGRLVIHGLFLRTPKSVRDIEALIASTQPGQTLPIEGAIEHRIDLEVE